MQFSDRLTRLFYNRHPGKIMARNIGMLLIDLVPGLKKNIMSKMTGLWGRQPAYVRGSAL